MRAAATGSARAPLRASPLARAPSDGPQLYKMNFFFYHVHFCTFRPTAASPRARRRATAQATTAIASPPTSAVVSLAGPVLVAPSRNATIVTRINIVRGRCRCPPVDARQDGRALIALNVRYSL